MSAVVTYRRVARKSHRCECGRLIQAGHVYLEHVGFPGDLLYSITRLWPVTGGLCGVHHTPLSAQPTGGNAGSQSGGGGVTDDQLRAWRQAIAANERAKRNNGRTYVVDPNPRWSTRWLCTCQYSDGDCAHIRATRRAVDA